MDAGLGNCQRKELSNMTDVNGLGSHLGTLEEPESMLEQCGHHYEISNPNILNSITGPPTFNHAFETQENNISFSKGNSVMQHTPIGPRELAMHYLIRSVLKHGPVGMDLNRLDIDLSDAPSELQEVIGRELEDIPAFVSREPANEVFITTDDKLHLTTKHLLREVVSPSLHQYSLLVIHVIEIFFEMKATQLHIETIYNELIGRFKKSFSKKLSWNVVQYLVSSFDVFVVHKVSGAIAHVSLNSVSISHEKICELFIQSLLEMNGPTTVENLERCCAQNVWFRSVGSKSQDGVAKILTSSAFTKIVDIVGRSGDTEIQALEFLYGNIQASVVVSLHSLPPLLAEETEGISNIVGTNLPEIKGFFAKYEQIFGLTNNDEIFLQPEEKQDYENGKYVLNIENTVGHVGDIPETAPFSRPAEKSQKSNPSFQKPNSLGLLRCVVIMLVAHDEMSFSDLLCVLQEVMLECLSGIVNEHDLKCYLMRFDIFLVGKKSVCLKRNPCKGTVIRLRGTSGLIRDSERGVMVAFNTSAAYIPPEIHRIHPTNYELMCYCEVLYIALHASSLPGDTDCRFNSDNKAILVWPQKGPNLWRLDDQALAKSTSPSFSNSTSRVSRNPAVETPDLWGLYSQGPSHWGAQNPHSFPTYYPYYNHQPVPSNIVQYYVGDPICTCPMFPHPHNSSFHAQNPMVYFFYE